MLQVFERGAVKGFDGGADVGARLHRLARVGTQGFQQVAGVASGLGQGGDAAVAGHHHGGLERLQRLEAGHPGFGFADRVQAQDAVGVNHITCEHHAAGGQDHQHVAGGVAAVAVDEAHAHAAKVQRAVGALQPAGGQHRLGAVLFVFQHRGVGPQMFGATGLHVGLGVGVGQGVCAVGFEVAVAQPAVVLSAGVDHPADGLRGHLSGSGDDVCAGLEGGTGVNQQRPGGRDHQANVGVEGFVLVGTAFGVAHMGVHAGSHGLEGDFHRLGGPGQGTAAKQCGGPGPVPQTMFLGNAGQWVAWHELVSGLWFVCLY